MLLTDWGYGNYWWPELGNSRETGRAVVYRSVPAGVDITGTACAHGLARAPRIGFRREGAGIRVHLSDAPPNALAFLLVGVSAQWLGPLRLPLDLTPFGLSGCTLYTSADVLIPVTVGATGNARGYACADIPLPLAASGGLLLFAQWKVLDANAHGIGVSQLLTWPVLPIGG